MHEGEVLLEAPERRFQHDVAYADSGVAGDLLDDEAGRPDQAGRGTGGGLIAHGEARAHREGEVGAEASHLAARREDLADLVAHEIGRRPRRVEAVAESGHTAVGGGRATADPERRIRLLHGLGVAADVTEAEELARVLRALVGPAALHHVEGLVAPRPAPLVR